MENLTIRKLLTMLSNSIGKTKKEIAEELDLEYQSFINWGDNRSRFQYKQAKLLEEYFKQFDIDCNVELNATWLLRVKNEQILVTDFKLN